MLPENVETKRGRYLQKIIQNTSPGEWADWPMLTQRDYVLVGQIIVLFSYVDYNPRRIAEAADHAGMLKPPWKGKSARLTIEQTEQAVKSLDWSDANQGALAKISKFRGLRNMLAHFVLRRFPKEDAFVCAAISARDYEKQLGVKPVPGAVLTAVLDHDQVKEAVKHIEHVQLWLARVTSEFELKFRQA
jgi:hypothetical protein